MGRPRRKVLAAAEESSTPPIALTTTQSIACVIKATGNNLYSCRLPDNKVILVELPSRFRNAIWIRNGGYVLVDSKDAQVRDNKIAGEIVNVVRDERGWRKEPYWPKEFFVASEYQEGSDEDESVTGMMSPSDGSDAET